MKKKPITQREQLWIITTAIILAGIVANYSSVGPSSTHIIVAKVAARDLLANILDGKKL